MSSKRPSVCPLRSRRRSWVPLLEQRLAALVAFARVVVLVRRIHLRFAERGVHMLEGDRGAQLKHDAIAPRSMRKLVVAEDGFVALEEEMALFFVPSTRENRHAKEVVLARTIADREN
ncbi:MAG: hypothetical protein ACK55Z_34095, partial [bacterium]